MISRKLTSPVDKELLIKHLCSLKGEDRRLRFGTVATDNYIETYVDASWKDEKSQWFGCTVRGKIVSACHAAIHNGEGELGCSVDNKYRGKGLAQEMFDRAVTYLRSQGITNVYMHCLTENQVMRHIAKKNQMTVVSCYGESDARVEVQPPTPLTAMKDAYLDRISMYDMLFRSNAEMYEEFLKNFKYGKKPNITWVDSKG
jgi:RimJ/RimL family protein N-acetyltransferase